MDWKETKKIIEDETKKIIAEKKTKNHFLDIMIIFLGIIIIQLSYFGITKNAMPWWGAILSGGLFGLCFTIFRNSQEKKRNKELIDQIMRGE